ncbi:MAG: hypothetical protein DRI54_08805 [Bacteroidetes bacterium]|nr:MAG: hypothetical protein DRI54_08805 [Bacteroidota bacterium]
MKTKITFKKSKAVFTFLNLLLLSLVSFSIQAQDCAEPPLDMVSWWSGDNHPLDIIGNNDGTIFNDVSFTDGVVEEGFVFDGIDDFVKVPNSSTLELAGDVTVELWSKRNAYEADDYTVISKGTSESISTDFLMRYVFIGVEFLFVDTNGDEIVIWAPDFEDGQFHHYAYVRSGNTHEVYVDGFSFGPVDFVDSPASSAGYPLIIGARYHNNTDPNTNFFNGVVDELSIYNRALSGTEIQSIFNSAGLGKCKNLLSVEDASLININVSVYPNPVQDILTIELEQDLINTSNDLKLIIYDSFGRTVKLIESLNGNQTQINLSQLPGGIYFYAIVDNKNTIKRGKIAKK